MIQKDPGSSIRETISKLVVPTVAEAPPELAIPREPAWTLPRCALGNFTPQQLLETREALREGRLNTEERAQLFRRVLENHQELSYARDAYLGLCDTLGNQIHRSLREGGAEERAAALRLFRRFAVPAEEIHPDMRRSAERFLQGAFRALVEPED